MPRTARSPEPATGLGELFREGLILSGAAVARSPLLVGGVTAFAVAMGFVATNALWYQPHFHEGAFFETRTVRLVPEAEHNRAIRETRQAPVPVEAPIERRVEQVAPQVPDTSLAEPVAPPPAGQAAAAQLAPNADRSVADVQRVLSQMNLYAGKIDGLTGPQTDGAIENYRRIVGLGSGSRIDAALLEQLGISRRDETTASIASSPASAPLNAPTPIPAPRSGERARPAPAQQLPAVQPAPQLASAEPDARIVRIQAGLRAFGNDGIELDGVIGGRTRSALKEFQALFRLPETGEPDEVTYAKMREIGLTE